MREALAVVERQPPVRPPEKPTRGECLQRAIRVHERQAERFGQMLLRDRHRQRAVVHERNLFGALIQSHQNERESFRGGVRAHAEQVFVEQTFAAGGEPRQ